MNTTPSAAGSADTPDAQQPTTPTTPTAASDTSTPAPPPPSPPSPGSPRGWLRAHSELGVCALLLVVGVLVLSDTLTMETVSSQRGPVGPRTVPLVVGCALLAVACVLAVDVLRGGKGEVEGGEDIDLAEPGDWRTVALLSGVFLAFAALIEPLGFPLAGALLFWGACYVLGSRNLTRDPLIAAVLSFAAYAVFNTALGVPLPGGPLMGVI